MAEESELIKMSELSRRCGVPAPTIKHYIREGLLPEPAKRTGRNMAYYDPNLVERIKTIKELQRTRFLPLKVIKDILDDVSDNTTDATTAEGLSLALAELSSQDNATRQEMVDAGTPNDELDWLEKEGLINAIKVNGKPGYGGDDLALLKTLRGARETGITEQMLPYTILKPYYAAIEQLVRAELTLFREGIVPHADSSLRDLAKTAGQFSEKIVILLRRKALIPTLSKVVQERERSNKKKK